jgi:hypothetical protein
MEQLERCLKPNLGQNYVIQSLQALLLATKSAKFAEAIEEMARLDLAGPDWESRLRSAAERISLGQINKLDMAIVLLASGCSQREIGDRVASQFGGGNSLSASSKAVRRMLANSELLRNSKLLDIPLATRRKQLKIARAKLGISDNQTLSQAQAVEVLMIVIEANRNANERKGEGGNSKRPDFPQTLRRSLRMVVTPELGITDIPKLKEIIESLVKATRQG